jgi:peptidoglycan/xylan/chitin deacetylase (PgdA/CDA1 family)
MRRVPVLAAAGGGVLAIAIVGFSISSFFKSADTVAVAPVKDKAELTTGSIAARWPNAPADSTAAATPPPSIQPAKAVPAQQAAAPNLAPAPAPACTNSAALGISRTVEIDTTGGPGLGLSQYREYDFLEPGEVALTFDDGPWPVNTPAVLNALAAECVKAVFFPIGKHSSWHPEILRQVVAQGHTIGSHTWSHVNLAKRPLQEAKDEIEKGISGVRLAAGRETAPFFRFPQLRQTPELKAYLGERNLATFSIDVDSEDFRIHKPDALIVSVMSKLKKTGKGIVLLHDFQKSTALALPELLQQLKAGGYKIVHITAKDNVVTLPDYDALVAPAPVVQSQARPASSVIRTVSGATR